MGLANGAEGGQGGTNLRLGDVVGAKRAGTFPTNTAQRRPICHCEERSDEESSAAGRPARDSERSEE